MIEGRDRSITTDAEKAMHWYGRICAARNAETERVAVLIENAMHTAESDETQKALLDLAIKVLRP